MPSSCSVSIFSLKDNKFQSSMCIIHFQPVTRNYKQSLAVLFSFLILCPTKDEKGEDLKKSMNERTLNDDLLVFGAVHSSSVSFAMNIKVLIIPKKSGIFPRGRKIEFKEFLLFYEGKYFENDVT